MIRPSKTFLFEILERKLRTITWGVGIDAASANMKNRHLFKTAEYIGIDIDPELVKQGMQNCGPNVTGIVADLSALDHLPSHSAAAVVSTNTLYHIPLAGRILAMEHLCRITSPGGLFLGELPLNNDFETLKAIAHKHFLEVQTLYFRNPLSSAYERLWERNGYLGSHPIAGLLPFRVLSYLISRLEYLTCLMPYGNKHALLVCTNKKNSPKLQPFTVSALHKTADGIIDLRTTSTPAATPAKKRVLLLVTKGEVGGAQTSVSLLAHELQNQGVLVTVGSGAGSFLPERLARSGVPHKQFSFLARTANPFTNIRFIRELYTYLRANPVDAIHLNSTNTLFGAVAARFVHPKPHVVFTYRGLSLISPSHGSRISRAFARLFFKTLLAFVHTTVFVSNTDYTEAKKLGLSKNGVVIHNGLNSEGLTFLPRNEARAQLAQLVGEPQLAQRLLIGSIGRISYQKNYQLLISAFVPVHKTHPNAHVVIIGDGPHRAECEALIKQLGLEANIHIVGEMHNASQFLSAFDVFVLPSRFEGLSLTLLETVFAGVPVVATDSGGNREVLGDAAWYFANNNSAALAVQLNAAIADDTRRASFAGKSRTRAPQFLIQKTASAYAALFTKPTL